MENNTLTMREVSRELGIPVYTIRYFCNHGLVPNVRRSRGGRRIFTLQQCDWLKSLCDLRECGFTIDELKKYSRLCRQGDDAIGERRAMLTTQKHQLRQEVERINQAIDFLERRDELLESISNDTNVEYGQWV